jgi:CRISPR/Cas system CSM-associated protein Csm2 small subunit
MKTNSALLLLLIVMSTFGKLENCVTDLKTAKTTLQTVIGRYNQTQNINNLIDDLTNMIKKVPAIMDDCGDNSGANYFRKELPDVCIDDM